jgi:Peptide N-acetyl-beta-D-glucosaminyl asparaginase amidase A
VYAESFLVVRLDANLCATDLNDTEVWRTSTAEPVNTGIIWTYVKDMSHVLPLWKQPQQLIFDLGNLVDKTYNGTFNTTLIATFFNSNTTQLAADLIIPVSKRQSAQNQPSAFRIPDDGAAANKLTIPRNAKRAVFSISACGQADEEFWWSNVPSTAISTFKNNSLPGYSPWRELQLWVDGNLAGVTWPFPIIFTGGVVPAFWRPVVGIDAFDLKEDVIDITPWLPALSDGKDHTYEIKVVGLTSDSNGRFSTTNVGSNWVVTGKIFLWLDAKGTVTQGDSPKVTIQEPRFTIEQIITKTSQGANDTLIYKVLATRELTIDGSITTSEGKIPAGWKQTLKFSNIGNVTAGGYNQSTIQKTSGTEIAGYGYSRNFDYPLECSSNTKYDSTTKELYIGGEFKRAKLVESFGAPIFPSGLDDFDSKGQPLALGFTVNTTQHGQAWYRNSPATNKTTGAGMTEQVLTFERDFGEMAKYPVVSIPEKFEFLYSRHIVAKNGRIDRDEEIELVELDPVGDLPIRVVEPSSDIEPLGVRDLIRAGGKRIRQLIGEPSGHPPRKRRHLNRSALDRLSL